jgi:hypothetical protein
MNKREYTVLKKIQAKEELDDDEVKVAARLVGKGWSQIGAGGFKLTTRGMGMLTTEDKRLALEAEGLVEDQETGAWTKVTENSAVTYATLEEAYREVIGDED